MSIREVIEMLSNIFPVIIEFLTSLFNKKEETEATE